MIQDTIAQVIQGAHDFMNADHDKMFILGTNKYGLAVVNYIQSKGVEVEGFIDDINAGSTFGSKPIYTMADIGAKDIVVNCIVEGRVIDARDNIKRSHAKFQIDYFSLHSIANENLPDVDFMSGTYTIDADKSEYNWLNDRLDDEESKHTLGALLNFRLNRDISFLERFEFRIEEQYFEPFFQLNEGAYFIDGGGFDGATTKLFTELYPNYAQVFYFEPNTESMVNSRMALRHVDRINYFELGLWNKQDDLRFDPSLGSASAISNEGSTVIHAASLDDQINAPISMIKLDIEGAELNAIDGATRTIVENRPVLAICVYHDQKDMWRVPRKVLKLVPDYKVYLRHYTQGVFETVMYFV